MDIQALVQALTNTLDPSLGKQAEAWLEEVCTPVDVYLDLKLSSVCCVQLPWLPEEFINPASQQLRSTAWRRRP